jgi:trigger factor
MKKENRVVAKQRKEEQRQKEERDRKVRKWLKIGIPVAVVVIAAAALLANKATTEKITDAQTDELSQAETGETNESGETRETDEAGRYLNTDTSLTVMDGDWVNIDFVGTVDGEEFDGGNTNGQGADLLIGSDTLIDDFEDQLVGHNVGETVEVTVTFDDDYGVEELNGKEAVFETTINGIYE